VVLLRRSGGPSDMSTAAPERHQRILHDVISNENLCLTQFALVEVGFDRGETKGVCGSHAARTIWHFQRKAGLPAGGVNGGRPDQQGASVLGAAGSREAQRPQACGRARAGRPGVAEAAARPWLVRIRS
jgi:hypothetical protein